MSEYIQLPLDFEIWKPIPGYETRYAVSNIGRVKGVADAANGSLKAGRILKPWPTTNGYLAITLIRNKTRETFRIHRLVAQMFIGECPDNHEVNHKDGNKANNSVENLEYVTHRDNQLHSFRVLKQRGRNTKGFRQLREHQVHDIRHRLNAETIGTLAKEYRVSRTTILNVKNGRTWKHIK